MRPFSSSSAQAGRRSVVVDTETRRRVFAAIGRFGNVRRDAMESLKVDEKKKEISEDDRKRSEEVVQKLTDQFVKETDEAAAKKEQEILTQ